MEDHKMWDFDCRNDFDLEATQVVIGNANDDYFNPQAMVTATYYLDAAVKNSEIEQEAMKDCNDDFIIPQDIPDDENDDFSWLFKVFPDESKESDQKVPTGEIDLSAQEKHCINNITVEAPEDSQSMLASVFSEMDVTSLISLDDDVNDTLTLYKAEPIIGKEEPNEPTRQQNRQILKRGRTRGKGSMFLNTTGTITDTPVSLRRSKRKRSYQEMIDAEVAVNEIVVSSESKELHYVANKKQVKRRRVQERQSEIKQNCTPTIETLKPIISELKITLRKHKPINPIDRGAISIYRYQKGLLDPRKILAGELYLQHAIAPQALPTMVEDVPSIVVERPLEPTEIKDLMRVEWMENHNTIANAKAHGKMLLGGKKLTADGNAIRGTFVTVDLDSEYENMLGNQNNCQTVINWKEKLDSRSHATHELEYENSSVNLDNTFSNFSNFENYFNDASTQVYEDSSRSIKLEAESQEKSKYNKIIGAVPVNKCALSDKSGGVDDKWALFRYKGQLYRPNPAVVHFQRVPDHVIQVMTSQPKKISLQSTYYNALTSYFEKRTT